MPKILLIDNTNLACRAFYATYRGPGTPLLRHDGFPTNAIHTWARMVGDLVARFPCDRVIFCLEGSSARRKAIWPDYKANRGPKPEELDQQLPAIDGLIEGSGNEFLHFPNEEADDVMGAAAAYFSKDHDVLIASGDKDLGQSVSDRVTQIKPYTGGIWKECTPASIREELGIETRQVAAYLALIGDQSDNIPGFGGIGPVRAKEILAGAVSMGEVHARLAAKKKISVDQARETLEIGLRLTTLFIDLDVATPRRATGGNEHPGVRRVVELRCHRAAAILLGLAKPAAVPAEAKPCQAELF